MATAANDNQPLEVELDMAVDCGTTPGDGALI